MIKDIQLLGQPNLLKRSAPVTNTDDPTIKQIIEEMLAAMEHYGGVGIAAPQIGYNVRIIALKIDNNQRYPNEEKIAQTILLNPSFEPVSEEKKGDWEGCLSVPGIRGFVKRHTRIRYAALMPNGQHIDETVNGFHARIIQHEIDHLDGILFPMRIENWSQLAYEQVLSAHAR